MFRSVERRNMTRPHLGDCENRRRVQGAQGVPGEQSMMKSRSRCGTVRPGVLAEDYSPVSANRWRLEGRRTRRYQRCMAPLDLSKHAGM